jgi:Mg2+ and Co2+ transporter CorA
LATTKAQQKLNVLAAWTFPLMTLAAVFGMNLRGGFENLPEIYFWLIFAAGIVLGMMAKAWVMRPAVEEPKKRPK